MTAAWSYTSSTIGSYCEPYVKSRVRIANVCSHVESYTFQLNQLSIFRHRLYY